MNKKGQSSRKKMERILKKELYKKVYLKDQ